MATAAKERVKSEIDAELVEAIEIPYSMTFTVRGVRWYFFSRPDVNEFEKKENAAPGSRLRKETDPETLVWRNEDGQLCCPGSQFKQAMLVAARYLPDVTKTGRKSLQTTFGEVVNVADELCTFGVKKWDDVDTRLVKYRNGAFGPRRRPVLYEGWETSCTVQVSEPQVVSPGTIAIIMQKAGLARGLGDNAKWGYGRFVVSEIGDPENLIW